MAIIKNDAPNPSPPPGPYIDRINTSSSNGLRWLYDIMQLFASQAVVVPSDYRTQILEVKKVLNSDVSGMVNTILDFSISASTLSYEVETKDKALDNILNTWLDEINIGVLGSVPVGITGLAKEYFRERWKGSSHLVLMTKWATVDGWKLPTTMWFADGENIEIANANNPSRVIGEDVYRLIKDSPGSKNNPNLNKLADRYFVQKPYEPWSCIYPTPYLIKKGIYRNLKFMEILTAKSEQIVSRAIEYFMFVKKGSEQLIASQGAEYSYSADDLKKITEEFQKLMDERKHTPKDRAPMHTSQFDTEIEHMIPDYEKATKTSIFTAAERRILAGLGLIEVVSGLTTTRREAILNPKPLETEVKNAVKDFKVLLTDVVRAILLENASHRKKTKVETLITSSGMSDFQTEDFKTLLRTLYDRGLLSKQTAVELIGEIPFNVELKRRENESKEDLDEKMYPPILTNVEQYNEPPKGQPVNPNTPDPKQSKDPNNKPTDKEKTPDKSGPEAKDFTKADVVYEEAPWKTNTDLPESVKVLPDHAQSIFRNAANSALKDGKDEQTAMKRGWGAVKNAGYHKNKDGEWVKKEESKD